MEDGWDFSGLVREAPIRIVGISDFFSHLYRSHTLLFGIRYGSSATSQDRDGFIENSTRATDCWGRLGSGSFDQLNLLDERRLRAADHVRAYQRKMARAFKKRVKPRPLLIGDLVQKVIRGLIRDPRGKFRPNWSGPYFIRELTPEGAAWLMDLDGNRFSEPTNVDQLKRYYVWDHGHRLSGHHFG